MGAVTIKGQVGRLRWGYQDAATLGRWSFVGSKREGGTVIAAVTARNVFASRQRPLAFVWSASGGRQESWPVVDVVDTAQGVTLTIAPW